MSSGKEPCEGTDRRRVDHRPLALSWGAHPMEEIHACEHDLPLARVVSGRGPQPSTPVGAGCHRTRQKDAEPGGRPDQRAVAEQLQLRRWPGGQDDLCPERAAGDPAQAERRLESHRPDHHAHHQPARRCSPGTDSAFGLGDINPTFFLSPAKPGTLIWGVGPTFTLPTATDSQLGTGKWSMGPAGVALTIQGPWVLGALANQQWSFAGWGDQDVSQLLIQPFVNYNLPDGWYLVSAPIITANWEASSGNTWTVPLGGGAGSCSRWANSRSTPSCRPLPTWSGPRFAADWQLRFQVQLLFPK